MVDGSEAIQMMRQHAREWHFAKNNVGIMGFSAGGHLASTIIVTDNDSLRPNFGILFYPVISMDVPKSHKWSCINFLGQEGHKDRNLINKYSTNNAVRRHLTPPAIILTASDDGLVNPVTNGLEYYKAMHDAGNECTLYSYPTGNHGWGFGPWFKYHDQMLNDLGNWLKNLQTPKEDAIKVACIGNSITDGYGIDFAPANGYPAQLQKILGNDYWVKNFGVSSRTMLNKGDYPYMNEMAWKDALAFKPDIVIIKLGTNDSKPENWQYNAEFKQDLQQMITTLRPDLLKPIKKGKKNKKQVIKNEGPQIFICTPIPAFKSTWNINDGIITNNIIPIQQQVAQEYNLQIIDLHSLFGDGKDTILDDGIHPNAKGAQKMAKIIADVIKQ
jgi:lysophospholipase L1-like esterase